MSSETFITLQTNTQPIYCLVARLRQFDSVHRIFCPLFSTGKVFLQQSRSARSHAVDCGCRLCHVCFAKSNGELQVGLLLLFELFLPRILLLALLCCPRYLVSLATATNLWGKKGKQDEEGRTKERNEEKPINS